MTHIWSSLPTCTLGLRWARLQSASSSLVGAASLSDRRIFSAVCSRISEPLTNDVWFEPLYLVFLTWALCTVFDITLLQRVMDKPHQSLTIMCGAESERSWRCIVDTWFVHMHTSQQPSVEPGLAVCCLLRFIAVEPFLFNSHDFSFIIPNILTTKFSHAVKQTAGWL